MSQKIFVKLKNIGKCDTLIREYKGSPKVEIKVGEEKNVEIQQAHLYAKNGKKFTIVSEELKKSEEPKKSEENKVKVSTDEIKLIRDLMESSEGEEKEKLKTVLNSLTDEEETKKSEEPKKSSSKK